MSILKLKHVVSYETSALQNIDLLVFNVFKTNCELTISVDATLTTSCGLSFIVINSR